MFEPRQNVRIKNGTRHNSHMWYSKYAIVVREMPGGQFVVLNTGETLDIIARVEDVEVV